MVLRFAILKLVLAVFALVAMLVPVWATGITDFKIQDQPKKIQLSFNFSDPFEYSTVSDFNSNILVLKIEGLELSKPQKQKDHRLEGDKDFKVLRFVRFQDTGEQAEIRIYLGWEVTPADAQVVAFDERIEVDVLKPLHLAAPVTNTSADEATWFIERDPAFGVTNDADDEAGLAEPNPIATGPDPTDPDGNSGMQVRSLRNPDFPELTSSDGTGGDSMETDSISEGESDPVEAGVDGIAGDAVGSDGNDDSNYPDPSGDFRPAREFSPTPSYKKFDLDDVEVNQLEFRGVPFNEVLLDLVAGTGFNVVVGEGIDNKELTLNFTKKKMTLKSALYILCTAYDLEYTVEDDAIIIRVKK